MTGNIATGGGGGNTNKATRRTFGDVQLETRYVLGTDRAARAELILSNSYTGVDTLDEPVTKTIVRALQRLE